MNAHFFALFFATLLQYSLQYRAAVLEYEPEKSTNSNILRYATLIKEAADKYSADIVAFPEGTLTTQLTSFQLVPDPDDKIIPYRNESYKKYRAVSLMSEAAALNKIYVVVNLLERVDCVNGSKDCPNRGYFLYNTNVAFDRKGMVVARYRKFNLFHEWTDQPKTPELSTFTTDFGVTFGMFICFDILFKSPTIDLVQKKNITNLIFSSFWFGELPFLTAVQAQSGWSYAMNVNLLASGANSPLIGSSGSGIYMKRERQVSYMLEMRGEVLIIRGINESLPTDSTHIKEPSDRANGLKLKQDPTIPLSESKILNAADGKFQDKICHGGFCCRFSAKYTKSSLINSSNYTYRAVAFQGKRYYREDALRNVNYCAILLCTDGNCAARPPDGDYPLIFDEIKIDADFKEKETLQMPSTLIWKDNELFQMFLHVMNYDMFDYETKKITGTDKVNVSIKLKTKDLGNLITFGIYGRDFTK